MPLEDELWQEELHELEEAELLEGEARALREVKECEEKKEAVKEPQSPPATFVDAGPIIDHSYKSDYRNKPHAKYLLLGSIQVHEDDYYPVSCCFCGRFFVDRMTEDLHSGLCNPRCSELGLILSRDKILEQLDNAQTSQAAAKGS